MKLSLNWLCDYLPVRHETGEQIKRYCDIMTASGSKVEGYERLGEDIVNVLVGRIGKIRPHPNADKLQVCSVDTGGGSALQIVTGAKNIAEGDLVPVAVAPAKLPGGKEINAGELRGEASEGMLCSISELGLTQNDVPYADSDGILVLREECSPGQDIRGVLCLSDDVVEFEITPNRPDCISVLGLARESAASMGDDFTPPVPAVKSTGSPESASDYLSVEILDPGLCSRYAARIIRDVKIGPSPAWMRARLRACGVRPINNIVDITNYILLEYGQPMHAFDSRFIEGGVISVRRAREGEAVTTLDSRPHKLTSANLVIADRVKTVAVAGVMGAENSEIQSDTTTVIFESANFNRMSVRLTAKSLGMRTEASALFEKGLDPDNALAALERACELVQLIGAGTVVDGVIDIYPDPHEMRTVPFEPEKINALLGTSLAEGEMTGYLSPLGITSAGGRLSIPSWRGDIEIVPDIAEEIARFYGYENLPSSRLRGERDLKDGKLTEYQKFLRGLHGLLTGQGLREIFTYSFVSPRDNDRINLPENSPLRVCVGIKNPLGEDTSVMRTSLLPSMMDVVSRNHARGNSDLALYEMARTYGVKLSDTALDRAAGNTPASETLTLCASITVKDDTLSFFVIKGLLENIIEYAGIKGVEIKSDISASPLRFAFHGGKCAAAVLNGRAIGILGRAHPKVEREYGVSEPAYLLSLDIDALYAARSTAKRYVPLPKYPALTRDLALVCSEDTESAEIERIIAASCGGILETLMLFDAYRSEKLGEGKKSYAYTLTFRHTERTLEDAEVSSAIASVLENLAEIGVIMRKTGEESVK